MVHKLYKDILLLFQSQAKSVACQPLHVEETYTKRKGVCVFVATVLCVSYPVQVEVWERLCGALLTHAVIVCTYVEDCEVCR